MWAVLGLLGALGFAWAAPRVYPLLPAWSTTRSEARDIAMELLRDLGDPVDRPYVVVTTVAQQDLEYLLQRAAHGEGWARVRGHPLRSYLVRWRVHVYAPATPRDEWAYRADVGRDGSVLALERRFPEEMAGEAIGAGEARRRAGQSLERYGFDLTAFADPELRTRQLAARTDTVVRFPWRDQPLGDEVRFGIEVRFAGAELAGFSQFTDDPDRSQRLAALQPLALLGILPLLSLFVLLPLLAIPFLKRYHAGEVGVRRGLQLAGLTLIAIAGTYLLASRVISQDWGLGVLTRQQTTWVLGLLQIVFHALPLALAVFCAWSVGESWTRERWGGKLAAFDALVKGELANATVARAAWRGTAAGSLMAGGVAVALVILSRFGAAPLSAFGQGSLWDLAHLGGLAVLAYYGVHVLYMELVARLVLVPLAVRRLGYWAGGIAAAVVGSLILWSVPMAILPVHWLLLVSLVYAAAAVALFLVWDLLTVMVMGLVCTILFDSLPVLLAAAPAIQIQGWIAVLGALLPMLLTVRNLGSAQEFRYRYDDIPPHVRRIAERERQKVELETARSIQSSILPELPPQLNGVPIAHAYLPATEVGGDFYDALALDDGRLALAVGDVAGHGASSGLIMAMAKSALAVQTTVNPDVEAVFTTLNRTVHQSARRRLLTTLCYAVLDPAERQLLYASAGHLFPYRVTAGGRVLALESIAYPLGVRPQLEVRTRNERLEAGDLIVLFSDGVVEARRPGSDEPFGFARLEEALRGQAGADPEQARHAVLEAVESFRGEGPREDDLTLLVVKIP